MNIEDAVVQLARLGLKGDVSSVGRLVRRFLRDSAGNPAVSLGTKDALASLIASQTSATMRFADGASSAGSSTPSFVNIHFPTVGEDPLLAPDVERQIEAVVGEHRRADALADVGLVPTRTILLTGPPGVGKTLTAYSLARRLDVPLYGIDLSRLISSFLGKTGQNLHEALRAARAEPSVMLLDEFDAIAKRRDDPSDVGELKRIVNVLLMELEAWPPTGLLVAATNHPELLDRAIWRRFERVIDIKVPSESVRRALLVRELEKLRHPATHRVVEASVVATEGASGSDVTALVRAGVRRSILEEKSIDVALSEEVLEWLHARTAVEPGARALYCQVASTYLKMSQRAIAANLGLSHVMVGKLLREPQPKPAPASGKGKRHV